MLLLRLLFGTKDIVKWLFRSRSEHTEKKRLFATLEESSSSGLLPLDDDCRPIFA